MKKLSGSLVLLIAIMMVAGIFANQAAAYNYGCSNGQVVCFDGSNQTFMQACASGVKPLCSSGGLQTGNSGGPTFLLYGATYEWDCSNGQAVCIDTQGTVQPAGTCTESSKPDCTPHWACIGFSGAGSYAECVENLNTVDNSQCSGQRQPSCTAGDYGVTAGNQTNVTTGGGGGNGGGGMTSAAAAQIVLTALQQSVSKIQGGLPSDVATLPLPVATGVTRLLVSITQAIALIQYSLSH